MLFSKLCFSFSAKNYINQFKVRNRLAQFFKHIHPDQMAQAPTKIKDQNLRSLKNFNSYLDAINQEKPIQGKLLKFYISQKTNAKSRKFFSFNLELPELTNQQVNMTQEKAGRLIDDIVNALNQKFKQSRGILQGKKPQKIQIQKEVKIQSQSEKMERMQQQVGPKTKFKRYIQQESLKKAIEAKYMQGQKEHLKLRLRQNMAMGNTPSNKPMMWSRIIMQDSGIYGDYQSILNDLIDPKLIYFSEEITVAQIEQFKKRILPGQLDRLGVRATHSVTQVCQQMQSYSPPICLYVTNHYGSKDIPGFYSVPFNFKPVEFKEQFQKNVQSILEERQRYEQQYDFFKDLAKSMLKKGFFKIHQPSFKNNKDIAAKIQVLQRIDKYQSDKLIQTHMLEIEDFKILCKQYNLSDQTTVHVLNNKIFLVLNFKDEHFRTALINISGNKHVATPSTV